VGGQRNVAAQKSLVVSDFDFESMGGAGIQVDVMTWSYDYTKNDGSTYQCPLPQKNGCNNPDNSALQIQIHSDCSWTQPCGDVPYPTMEPSAHLGMDTVFPQMDSRPFR
jgi:hypothetical protein